MVSTNHHNPTVSTPPLSRQHRAVVLGLVVAGVLAFSAFLPTIANAQSDRFNIQQVGDALNTYGKNTVNNNGQTYYSVVCGHDSWKSSVIVSLSPSGNVIWLQLNLVELPAHVSTAALANLLKKSNDLGPTFFSLDGDWLRIATPLPNNDMTEAKLKGYLENLVNAAVDSHDLWDPKVLESTTTAHAPTPGSKSSSAHSSLSRSVDEFDKSLSSVQHQ